MVYGSFWSGSGYCVHRIWRYASIKSTLLHAPQKYTNQRTDVVTNIPAPHEDPTNLGNLRTALTNAGVAIQNEVSASLDPSEWERPGPNGSPPGGFKISWPDPNPGETYDAYISRLHVLGYWGQITPITLEEDNGDPQYGAGGVPCTSISGGAVIGAGDPATVYVNASTLGTCDPEPTAPGCLGRLDTSKYSNVCTFATRPYPDDPDHQSACANSWGDFWLRQTVFDDAGNIIDMSQVHDMIAGDEFGDKELLDKLLAIDPVKAHWIKARTDPYDGTYEIHFYYNTVTKLARFDIDFKLRYLNPF